MRDAWVLLSSGAGDVICCKVGVESKGTVLSFGAGGEQNGGVGAGLAKAAGERFRWEAWMVLIWLAGAALRAGAVFSCGAGGREVTREEVLSGGTEGGEVLGRSEKVGAEVSEGAEGVVVSGGAE